MEGEPPKKVARVTSTKPVVGFVGLGAMGRPMVGALLKEGFTVHAFDPHPPALQAAVASGAQGHKSTLEVASAGIEVLVLMVVSAAQAEEVLSEATRALPKGSVAILGSTVAASSAEHLATQLSKVGIHFVDAPVSGGPVKAAEGTLTIMAGGEPAAMDKARPVLEAMSANLFHVGPRAGCGSSMKMVNQLLAGVHIVAAAEALALGVRAGLDSRKIFEVISTATGNSWVFGDRGARMLDEDFLPPKSQLDIFVKDLGIVLGEAKQLTVPCHLAAMAHQQFLAGSAAGFGQLDDSAVVKVIEQSTGVRVAAPRPEPGQRRKWPSRQLAKTLAALPPPAEEGLVSAEIRSAIGSGRVRKLVVLDDDPTGTQTVRGITVLTEWPEEALVKQLKSSAPGFYILTNSRALAPQEARALIVEICRAVQNATRAAGVECSVLLRGDSTMRGHYPTEPDAASEVFGDFDVTMICPFFFQGGRYTIDDVHYVATGDVLTPAAETEFAKDKAFGFKESNLKDWVEEKTSGRVSAQSVASISLAELRQANGSEVVKERIMALPKGSVLIVNAVAEVDIGVFVAGQLRAEAMGKTVLCRTGASYVAARMGIDTSKTPLVTPGLLPPGSVQGSGALIVVGSYVGKSTAQVDELWARAAQRSTKMHKIELSVPEILKGSKQGEDLAKEAARKADALLQAGDDVLIVTSRTLVHGSTPRESLQIGAAVSDCLVQTVRALTTRPRYVLAKGGITSSDLATKGLGAKDALVPGQALPGVPVWLLGSGSRWESMPYIVFPGNVGAVDAISTVVSTWAAPPASVAKLGWWQQGDAAP